MRGDAVPRKDTWLPAPSVPMAPGDQPSQLTAPTRRRWAFIGADALPADPDARAHERRGRRWLFLSYVVCPCHVPVTLVIVSAVLGGSALGAAVTGNAFRVGVLFTVAYAVAVWRGFRQIRWAKRIEAGRSLECTPGGCAAT